MDLLSFREKPSLSEIALQDLTEKAYIHNPQGEYASTAGTDVQWGKNRPKTQIQILCIVFDSHFNDGMHFEVCTVRRVLSGFPQEVSSEKKGFGYFWFCILTQSHT